MECWAGGCHLNQVGREGSRGSPGELPAKQRVQHIQRLLGEWGQPAGGRAGREGPPGSGRFGVWKGSPFSTSGQRDLQ